MIRACVVGASGYGGRELLRLLAGHPDVDVAQATSRSPGARIDELHPGLRGVVDLALTPTDPAALDPDVDVVFLALPHGQSAPIMAGVQARCPQARIFDLAQDFRTGFEDQGWVYGQPELFREQLRTARYVACPGCFATAIGLATAPALQLAQAPERIIVDAKTGSSGSGASPKALTHHPVRVGTFKAYKVFAHQHEREIKALWQRMSDREGVPTLNFVPQSSPLVRGIYACCYLIYSAAPPAGLSDHYSALADNSSFVRVVDEPPNVLAVRGTNNVDLYLQHSGGLVLVIAAIDNLVRGAAGQAVQCMNIAFGLAEEAGLKIAAWVP